MNRNGNAILSENPGIRVNLPLERNGYQPKPQADRIFLKRPEVVPLSTCLHVYMAKKGSMFVQSTCNSEELLKIAWK